MRPGVSDRRQGGQRRLPFVVTVDHQASNNDIQFTYFVAPTVSSVSPVSGSQYGGTSVTITGSNFAGTPGSPYAGTVTLGGTAATNVTIVTATQITASTAARVPGTVDVIVTNPDNRSGTCTGCYTYLDAPTVTRVSPSSGPSTGATTVTIIGTSFAAGASVTVGGASATAVSVISSTTITATTPAGTGTVDVIVTVDGQSSAQNASDTFTYTIGPTISNVQASANRHSATITWTTDVPADSQVEYGTTTAYDSKSALNTTRVTSHAVNLNGLARFTTYHYRVYSRDSAGQLTISTDRTFTTR